MNTTKTNKRNGVSLIKTLILVVFFIGGLVGMVYHFTAERQRTIRSNRINEIRQWRVVTVTNDGRRFAVADGFNGAFSICEITEASLIDKPVSKNAESNGPPFAARADESIFAPSAVTGRVEYSVIARKQIEESDPGDYLNVAKFTNDVIWLNFPDRIFILANVPIGTWDRILSTEFFRTNLAHKAVLDAYSFSKGGGGIDVLWYQTNR